MAINVRGLLLLQHLAHTKNYAIMLLHTEQQMSP